MNMLLDQAALKPSAALADVPLRGVRPNIVQSIRAFRVPDLQAAAQGLGHHFLYANLASAQSKQDVLDLISQQFMLTVQVGKNFDSLYDSMTDPVHKSGPQPGFIAVLEHIPANAKFDKEAREQLLDIFRDTADYWGDRKIPFRCFYSFLEPVLHTPAKQTGRTRLTATTAPPSRVEKPLKFTPKPARRCPLTSCWTFRPKRCA